MAPRAEASIALLWGEDPFLLREAALARLGGVRVTEVDADHTDRPTIAPHKAQIHSRGE